MWSRAGTNSADPGGEFSVDHSACQTTESGPHVNDIINSSRTKAWAMVDAAMQVHIERHLINLWCKSSIIVINPLLQ